MKRILLVIFLLSQVVIAGAQINVKSFRLLENDLDARVHHPKRDQNGEVCAIIKVVTTQTGFSFDVGSLGVMATEQKKGEIWVYVPRGVQRITITHSQLGVLRNYALGIPIQTATVYELELTTARVTTIIEDEIIPTQWLVISSVPEGADVYINDQLRGQTPFQMEFEVGEYSYRVEKLLYHPEAGKLTLTADNRETRNFSLRPNFGYIKVSTTPESVANVTVNGNPLTSSSPVTTGMLKSGVYTVEVAKQLFHSTSQEVTVTDGETTNVTLAMRPAFAGISVKTTPESGAEVLLNGNPTGKTTPTTLERLPRGEHTITVRKDWYQPQTQRVTVTDGADQNLNITLQPTFGNVKITADADAAIFIANERKANGSWEGRLVAGLYTVEARKDKHTTDTQQLQVELGQAHNLSLHPKPMQGELKVVTTPFDAKITLNGKDYGTTPTTIRSLLIGSYSLTLEKQGYGTVTKTVTIAEGQTAEVDETLPSGMEVTIASNPSGAQLWVDGVSVGTTPYKTTLAFSSHSVKLINGKKEVTETISVTQGGKTRWEFDVAEFSPSGTFTDTRDGKTYKYVTIGKQVWMAENLAYKPSSGNYWAYDNNQSNVNRYGYLYDWKTAKNVCPTGWHLPSDAEWTQLTNFVGTNSGTKLKAKNGWSKNEYIADDYGFSALPGGYCNKRAKFDFIREAGAWWCSSKYNILNGWRRSIMNDQKGEVFRNGSDKSWGFSVRCVRD